MKDTVLIYSGGLDSTAALHVFKDSIALAISFDYGSRHNLQEISKAAINCCKLDIPHKVIDLKSIFTHMHSSLLGSEPIPHGHYAEDNMRSTVVPFRNGIMLSIAAGIAESAGLKKVMLASHRGDNSQYPDCTQLFNISMHNAIEAGTSTGVSIEAPFSFMTKRDIARAGIKAGMLAEATYSCYEGGEIHCGKCGTCVERIWALQGLEDSTEYKNKRFALDILAAKGEL